MALTPQDVHDKQFRLVRQSTGYDIDEVDSFLDEVEAELVRLTDALVALGGDASAAGAGGPSDAEADEAGADEVAGEAGAVDGDDGATGPDGSASLVGAAGAAPRPALGESASAAAARILELAQKTAEEYLADAQRQADRLRSEASGLETRVAELRAFETQVRGRLRGYLQGELERLAQAVGDD